MCLIMKDNIKVLHLVSGSLSGGAARGAYWLHQGLLNLGIESKVLIKSREIIDDSSVHSILTGNKQKLKGVLDSQLDQLPVKFYRRRKDFIFSTGTRGFDITKHPLYQWADLIHMHWINDGFISIKDVGKIEKPILWTLRDMWPFTGGCHYSMDCIKYKTGCGSCIQLGSTKKYDLSHLILRRKEKNYSSKMQIVAISSWLKEKAKESRVFKDFKIHTIPNNVNCTDFFPIDKKLARNILGIKTTKRIILVGAQDVKDFYKGFGKFLAAIETLDRENYYLAFFGRFDKETIERLGFEFKNLGFLNDIISLRLLYSAADVFVAPSIMDAFGKTLVEAMACGTPVVCFDATGPKDIVDHKINGYKAIPFEIEDLSRGIKWVLSNNRVELNSEARNKALKMFDTEVIANQYSKLYSTF